MNFNFHKVFNTHEVYITLDDGKIYKLIKEDLSKELVESIPVPTKNRRIMVAHKSQFDGAKSFLMDVSNPFRLTIDAARDYKEIGFISDLELAEYEKKIESKEEYFQGFQIVEVESTELCNNYKWTPEILKDGN